jgi:hypothetical protein
MRPDDDDLQIIVSAQQFELLNTLGGVSAQFGSVFGQASLFFNHLSTAAFRAPNPPGGQSTINWSQYSALGNDAINMLGPPGPAGSPGLYLESTPTTSDASIDSRPGGAHVTVYDHAYPVVGVDIDAAGGFINLNTSGGASMTLNGVTGQVQILGLGFTNVFDTDPWVNFTPTMVASGGGWFPGTTPSLEGRGQRLGSTFVGTWSVVPNGAGIAPGAGAFYTLGGWPTPAAGPFYRTIGSGFIYNGATNTFFPVTLRRDGIVNFQGVGATFRPGAPIGPVANDIISLQLSYECA